MYEHCKETLDVGQYLDAKVSFSGYCVVLRFHLLFELSRWINWIQIRSAETNKLNTTNKQQIEFYKRHTNYGILQTHNQIMKNWALEKTAR